MSEQAPSRKRETTEGDVITVTRARSDTAPVDAAVVEATTPPPVNTAPQHHPYDIVNVTAVIPVSVNTSYSSF